MLPTFQYPKAWATTQLRSALDSIQYGYTASGVSEKAGPKFLRITDLEGGPLNWSKVPHCICKKPMVTDWHRVILLSPARARRRERVTCFVIFLNQPSLPPI
jgi:hypothetical protein